MLIYTGRSVEIIVPSFIHVKRRSDRMEMENFYNPYSCLCRYSGYLLLYLSLFVFFIGGEKSLGPISLSRLWDLHAEAPLALMSYLHKFPGNRWAHRPCFVLLIILHRNLTPTLNEALKNLDEGKVSFTVQILALQKLCLRHYSFCGTGKEGVETRRKERQALGVNLLLLTLHQLKASISRNQLSFENCDTDEHKC